MANNFHNIYEPLSPISLSIEDSKNHSVSPLEPIRPGFFIPRLDNKPQNPIIDALELEFARLQRKERETIVSSLPLTNKTNDTSGITLQVNGVQPPFDRHNPLGIHINSDDQARSDVWMNAASSFKADDTLLKTWDDLRPNYSHNESDGALLSEQLPLVFDSLQEFIIPHVRANKTTTLQIPLGRLLEVLMVNLVGHSSQHYDWDSSTKVFRPSGLYKNRILVASGYTENTTHSLIRMCLDIGGHLRKLDDFIDMMRTQTTETLHPTTHAFLHALETVLSLLRKQLTRAKNEVPKGMSRLSLYLADIELCFKALEELCCMDGSSTTSSQILKQPSTLLAHIYTYLEHHMQSSSPRTLRGILAYMLTITSNPYFRTVEKSIGIGRSKGLKSSNVFNPGGFGSQDDEFDGDQVDVRDPVEAEDHLDPNSYPAFFSDELRSQMINANKGLKVLAAADPNHPLLKEVAERQCKWVWQEHEVDAIYTGINDLPFTHQMPPTTNLHFSDIAELTESSFSLEDNIEAGETNKVQYKPEIVQFRVFDQEPGSQFKPASAGVSSIIDTVALQSFLAMFPEDLPVSTPSLSHLSTVVLHPLQVQINRLSNALLDLFLSPPFFLPSHFSLLRSFLLLSSQNFTYRLRSALFSESDSYQPVGRGTRARTRARLGIKNEKDIIAETDELNAANGDGLATAAKWGIGLGIGLSERGEWPPGGAELGFALRRVIVDTLDKIRFSKGSIVEYSTSLLDEGSFEAGAEDPVIKEAEWRLGFAIRDLPVDEGREEWLNPSSLAALDFLYLDYKPPRPVAALIDADILSKYHRIFTFLLRLLRVETVSRSLFHSISRGKNKGKGTDLFPTNQAAANLTRRFRFFTHSFVSTLIGYVFDTAIGVNLDRFMARLEEISEQHKQKRINSQSQLDASAQVNSDSAANGETPPIADIFAILQDHSKVLDKVLSGCMLRTQQRAISDVVDDILNTILRFGTLIRDLRRRAMKEEVAANQLGKLHTNFERKMIAFTKVLRAMDDKSELRSLLSALATNDRDYEILSRNAIGANSGTSAGQKREVGLSDLLARLDPGEWWKSEMERKAKAKREKERER